MDTEKLYSIWYIPGKRWTNLWYEPFRSHQNTKKPFRLTYDQCLQWKLQEHIQHDHNFLIKEIKLDDAEQRLQYAMKYL